ncbi:hypothetical protein EHQ58_14225 [Leptospira ognonensis]|uniref:1-aminocyclopropane-1-carboxylate deaminase n=1 Tax=Leptospira ognonensis TaxID=2484945 RepID=A0A4V3JQW0_9LEPT|nr:hypothetical protein [Leptospira ognonensis]TGL57436.1 hypothetical protein EHQ58_14225 [Leptospira ognonensis]
MYGDVREAVKTLPLRLTNIQLTSDTNEIVVIRDDLLCFGLGTKIRKLQGLLFIQKLTNPILLWGSLHGNFLAAYSFLLPKFGFDTKIFAYARNLQFHSANRILIENNTGFIHYFSSRTELLVALENFKREKSHANWNILPEFGFDESALLGLNQLWSELEVRIPKKKTLFLEIGSGLTFLSALSYFSGTEVTVCATAVGESRESFLGQMPHLQKKIGLSDAKYPKHFILEPLSSKKFGRVNQEEATLVRKIYNEMGIFIEPIYGIKTWQYFLNSKALPENLPKPWVYLHQGGQLNHLDLLLTK